MKFLTIAVLAIAATVAAAVPTCTTNYDAILRAATQGEGGRCVTQTGFQFLQPVANNASLSTFCANPLCQSTWSKITELVTEECLVDGVNVKRDVLDKLKGRCNAPEVPRCSNSEDIAFSAMSGIGGRCGRQTGIYLVYPVASNSAFSLFCSSDQCLGAWSTVSSLVTTECLVDGVLMKKDVLDVVAAGCAATTTAPPKPDCPSTA